MLIIYWCCSRGKVYPPVQRQLFHSQVLFGFFFTVVTHGGRVTSGRHIACQVSSPPPRPQTAEVLLFGSHVRVPSCHIWCECLVFRLPELISRALGRIPRAALSCDISPRCAVRQPAPSPLQICKLTQMTLRVPLETRCSEIRKDPFHTSAARQRDGWTKRKWEGGRIKEGEWERLVGGLDLKRCLIHRAPLSAEGLKIETNGLKKKKTPYFLSWFFFSFPFWSCRKYNGFVWMWRMWKRGWKWLRCSFIYVSFYCYHHACLLFTRAKRRRWLSGADDRKKCFLFEKVLARGQDILPGYNLTLKLSKSVDPSRSRSPEFLSGFSLPSSRVPCERIQPEFEAPWLLCGWVGGWDVPRFTRGWSGLRGRGYCREGAVAALF